MHQVTLEKTASGDLNSDGVDDAAVILAWKNGCSGTFRDLVAVQNTSGLPQQIDSFLFGDRIQVSDLQIITHTHLDPMCCLSHPLN